MATFVWRGRNAAGEKVEGRLEAANPEAVINYLNLNRIVPLGVEAARATVERKEIRLSWRKPSVSTEELIMFCRQMNSLTRAGVPLVRALRTLAASSRSETLRQNLSDAVDALESGQELSTALGRHRDTFSPLFINMIHVGENTGRLEDAFVELARHLDMERETKKRMQQATRYPTFVVGAIGAAVLIINFFVIPAFAKVFEKLGADLPLPTRILIGTSNFLINYSWLLVALIVLAVWLIKRWLATADGRLTWDRWKLKLPIVGSIFERIMLARFSRSFAMMMRAGVPVVQTLNVVSRALGNEFIGQAVRGMASQIERGDTITRTATQTGLFTPLVLQMLLVGEESGTLEEMLGEVADFYEGEVDYDLKRLTDKIEPILIVAIGVLVLILALGVFLPIWDLGSAFRGKH